MRFVLFLNVLAILFWNCGKRGELNLLSKIPARAVGVTVVELGKLHQKANVKALLQQAEFRNWFKGVKEDKQKQTEFLLAFPEETGLYANRLCAYSAVDTSAPDSLLFHAVLLAVKDRSRLEKTLGALLGTDEKPWQPQQGKGCSYVLWGKDMYLAWNAELLCLAGSLDTAGAKNSLPSVEDLLGRTPYAPEQSIERVEPFAGYLAQKHDVLVWWSPDAHIEHFFKDKRRSREYQGYLFLAGLSSDMLKGCRAAAWLNFGQGEIAVGAEYAFSPALKQTLGTYFKKQPETNWAAHLPKQNLAAVLSLAIDPQAVRDHFEKNRLNVPADVWFGYYKSSLQEAAQSLGGDALLAVYLSEFDLDTASDEDDGTASSGLELLAGIRLKKNDAADKITDMVAALLDSKVFRKGKTAYIQHPDLPLPLYVRLAEKEGLLLFGTNAGRLETAVRGVLPEKERASDFYMQALQSSIAGAYLDHTVEVDGVGALSLLAMLTNMLPPIAADALSEYDEIKNTLIDIKNEQAGMQMELKTKDRNAVQRFLELSSKMYADWQDVANYKEED